jgi:hypothetical protein
MIFAILFVAHDCAEYIILFKTLGFLVFQSALYLMSCLLDDWYSGKCIAAWSLTFKKVLLNYLSGEYKWEYLFMLLLIHLAFHGIRMDYRNSKLRTSL